MSAPIETSAHDLLQQPNGEGAALTFSTTGSIQTSNPFFTPLGNGRSCASCHQESQGWSVTPDGLAVRFEQSNGTDPIFKLVDGATFPNAPVDTLEQKRVAYTLLLTKGLVRIGLPLPPAAEFTLSDTDDPYGYASAAEMSLFRRPLPTANLKFSSTVMWDGRETAIDANSKNCIAGALPAKCYASIDFDLLHQANSAVRGHAEAAIDLSAADQRAIVDFEKTLFTAQIFSTDAGNLNDGGALGGPAALAKNDFYFGINDAVSGDYVTGMPFNRNSMTMFSAWRHSADLPPLQNPTAIELARTSIARGEDIFNSKQFTINGVGGFGDELNGSTRQGSCTSCHSTPNSGTHSIARLFNTGVSDGSLRTPDLPLYSLKNKMTGEIVTSTDPGAALTSGKWQDIGRFKVPSLRAIEARSPYFHNGALKELSDVVKFYDRRFKIGFTPQEVADLTAFLKVL